MSTFDSDRLLNVVKVLALAISGIWVLFRYFDHERAMADIQLQQQQLLKEQAAVTLNISKEQRNLRTTELQNDVEMQKQDLELRRLQQERARVELANASKYRFLPDASVTTRKLRSHGGVAEYEVSLYFGVTNKADGPFAISTLVVDYFLGVPKHLPAGQALSIEPMGQPTDRWNPGGAVDGALNWSLQGYAASTAPVPPAKMIPKVWERLLPLHPVRGGPGTGSVPSGQTAIYEDTFLVRAPEHSYVAFVVSYCFNDCIAQEDYYSYTKTEELGGRTSAPRTATTELASAKP